MPRTILKSTESFIREVMAGAYAKDAAYRFGISPERARNILNKHGIFKEYLTRDEWAEVKARRAQKQMKVAA